MATERKAKKKVPPANPNSVITGNPAAAENTMVIFAFMGNISETPKENNEL